VLPSDLLATIPAVVFVPRGVVIVSFTTDVNGAPEMGFGDSAA
jgi:hypothetical protein